MSQIHSNLSQVSFDFRIKIETLVSICFKSRFCFFHRYFEARRSFLEKKSEIAVVRSRANILRDHLEIDAALKCSAMRFKGLLEALNPTFFMLFKHNIGEAYSKPISQVHTGGGGGVFYIYFTFRHTRYTSTSPFYSARVNKSDYWRDVSFFPASRIGRFDASNQIQSDQIRQHTRITGQHVMFFRLKLSNTKQNLKDFVAADFNEKRYPTSHKPVNHLNLKSLPL